MSNAEQYADSDNISIAQAKREIAAVLRTKQGKENAISSKDLANMVGLKATTVRDLIPEIRRVLKVPIDSCPGGYFVIDNDEDFTQAMQRKERKRETTRQHQKELAAAYNSERYS